MSLDLVIAAFLTVVNITTPILLAATGELVVEKSGVLNLGVEGMMLCGAIAGFAITFVCSDPELADSHPWLVAAGPWLGVVAAAAAGALGSLLFGFMALTLGANQVASGLALVIFGTGISSLIGTAYIGIAIQPFDQLFPDSLAQAPIGTDRIRLQPAGLFLAHHGRRGRLVPQPHARGAGSARGRRERSLRAFDRLFGASACAISR